MNITFREPDIGQLCGELNETVMKANMLTSDRAIRLIVAIILGILYFSHVVTGMAGVILLIVGTISLITSFTGFCPLYRLLGLNFHTRTQR
jgi:hypothetical protein